MSARRHWGDDQEERQRVVMKAQDAYAIGSQAREQANAALSAVADLEGRLDRLELAIDRADAYLRRLAPLIERLDKAQATVVAGNRTVTAQSVRRKVGRPAA